MERVGRQGVVTMEESRTAEDNLYVVEGMQFDRGYISPYFVTDPERMARAPLCHLHRSVVDRLDVASAAESVSVCCASSKQETQEVSTGPCHAVHLQAVLRPEQPQHEGCALGLEAAPLLCAHRMPCLRPERPHAHRWRSSRTAASCWWTRR